MTKAKQTRQARRLDVQIFFLLPQPGVAALRSEGIRGFTGMGGWQDDGGKMMYRLDHDIILPPLFRLDLFWS